MCLKVNDLRRSLMVFQRVGEWGGGSVRILEDSAGMNGLGAGVVCD